MGEHKINAAIDASVLYYLFVLYTFSFNIALARTLVVPLFCKLPQLRDLTIMRPADKWFIYLGKVEERFQIQIILFAKFIYKRDCEVVASEWVSLE